MGDLFQMAGIMIPPGQVLLTSVTQSHYGNARMINCIEKCGDISTCHSINWYRDLGLCQLNNDTHLSYPEGVVSSSTGNYMIYGIHPMKTCSNQICEEPRVCLMEEDGLHFKCKDNCTSALGMQDGRIRDSQISASSSYRYDHVPQNGRLHSSVGQGIWAPASLSLPQYLQIDIVKSHIISLVATQGRENLVSQWVTKYYLMFSQDALEWEAYKYGGSLKVWTTTLRVWTKS
ncbi:lactadherin-like [Exaiptasia diaphana]|uniref:F5/8 type C domain-containing protein n=1 Tax=Exaiptasia diaphana TaxID=2652724 RepID=A0A913YQU9_EXADI|nr:lactadherin-like [Exaiptasia diaphana]